jgi:hypothetical protein
VHRPPYWHPWTRPGYGRWHWWAGCSAAAIGGWFVGSAFSQPIYYSYGTGGNVYYEDNSVYIDGQEYCTAEQYYQQADQIATNVPDYSEQQAEELEWLPLGVWALTSKEGESESNRVLQLAVNKQGVIAGTFYNETTGTTVDIEGSVEEETQRAAWRPVDEKNQDIVMETGVYNLTDDVTYALLHFGPDKTQEIAMVRLEEPSSDEE